MTEILDNDIKEAKAVVKPVKRVAKPPLSAVTVKTDRERIHDMAILFLDKLKTASNARAAYHENGKPLETVASKHYKIMFGKESYVDTLVTISDLLLKLEQLTGDEMVENALLLQGLDIADADSVLLGDITTHAPHKY